MQRRDKSLHFYKSIAFFPNINSSPHYLFLSHSLIFYPKQLTSLFISLSLSYFLSFIASRLHFLFSFLLPFLPLCL